MRTPEPIRTDYPFTNAQSTSPRSLESGIRRFAQPKSRGGICGLLSNIFSRSPRQDLDIPIQERPGISGVILQPDAPSRLRKKNGPPCHYLDNGEKRKNRIFWIVVILILLYLFGNMVAVNIQVFSKQSTTISDGSGKSLSFTQQTCLAQFTINAQANASTYPCATCLPILQNISSDVSFLSQGESQTLQNSLQFCGLQSLVTASSSGVQASLMNGGWVQNTNFCTWSGVQCNGDGKVSSLEFTFPNVPSILPSGVGALTSMQTLKITGDGNIPAGSLPDSFMSLTSLQTLDLESTALDAFPSNLFSDGSFGGLTSLSFVKNANFDGSLPTLGDLKLQSLIVNDQTISTSLDKLLTGSNLQGSLQTLSITSASINTTFPSFSSFSSLKELHLDFDNLSGSIPSDAFPNSLQILSLENNTALTGSMPSNLCSSSILSTCSLAGTATSLGSGCGVCTL